ncbi:acyl-CoA thioesterase [Salipiger abyssi]|uniref:4-hydroxybenzoyl-CoA thioesterase n=1 Tax=Salipiger abyssi TaxID=1250539 RepID=A0A1P8UMF3_9RHOB|nr:acyl-CoA thioesterase [Salipiger abyssi]APZ50538.1 4-hydroxybenzoyl-CoA thioesterase [Salipiger abyssi]
MAHLMTVDVTFGDCDPAGIVFYPNIFRWMDAGFQKLLRPLGGHQKLCRDLDSLGLGLADAQAQFRSTIRDGDLLELHVSVEKWSARSVTLAYEGRVGERLAFEGREVRCLFIRGKDGIVAGDMNAFRERLEKAE